MDYELENFYATQDEIMNRLRESVAEYLARRQRSGFTFGIGFSRELIPQGNSMDTVSTSTFFPPRLQVSLSPERQDTGSDVMGPNEAQKACGASSVNVDDVRRQSVSKEAETQCKRKADKAGPDIDQRPNKKSKSSGMEPIRIPTIPTAPLRPRQPKSSSDVHSAEKGSQKKPTAETAFAASETDVRAREGASGLVRPPSGSDGPNSNDRKDTDSAKVGFGPRNASADSSYITTPSNTAPPMVTPVEKVVRGKGKATARGPVRRPTAKASSSRGPPTSKNPKGLRYTPSEYARRIQEQYAQAEAQKWKGRPFLTGKRIFFYGGDMHYAVETTRNRMKLICKHGGQLLPEFDPDTTTHIVTDADKGTLLSHLKLRKLSDIPLHIPIVNWSWVRSGMGSDPNSLTKGRSVSILADGSVEYTYSIDHESEHPAYKERVFPRPESQEEPQPRGGQERAASSRKVQIGGSRNADTARAVESSEDISQISEFTQDKIVPGNGGKLAPRGGLPSPPSSPDDTRSEAIDNPRPKVNETGYPHASTSASTPSSSSSSARGEGQGPPAGPVDPSTSDANATANADDVAGSSFDVLAEFYPLARAERDAEMFGDAEPDNDLGAWEDEDEDEDDADTGTGTGAGAGEGNQRKRRKGFLCDDKNARNAQEECPNKDIVAKLSELRELLSLKPGEEAMWRVFGLNKAIASLRRYPKRIESEAEARKLHGIGIKTAEKIMEIIETGNLRRIEYENTADIAAIRLFTGIYGVGKHTAIVWYNRGCRTLADVAARKGGIRLSEAQEIGLRYYDDINTRIPRAEVQEIYNIIRAEALKIDPDLYVEVMGSFRRLKADCGDIDVLLTRPTDDGKTHKGALRQLLARLHEMGIITDDLSVTGNLNNLEITYHGLCQLDRDSPRRRIDFLTVPWKSRGGALLYYTGDDIFNRSLRLKANKMGYSLNQRGLYAGVIRDPKEWRKKLHAGNLIASESEREIFRILGVPWQEPYERIRN